jgi:multiple sugar transport system permease protein
MILHFTYLLLGSAGVVLLLTRGGPGTSSLTLGYYLYEQAFKVRMIGYSQAIGVFIFLIGLIGMIVIRNRTNRSYQ